jgi:hypothetical protein
MGGVFLLVFAGHLLEDFVAQPITGSPTRRRAGERISHTSSLTT